MKTNAEYYANCDKALASRIPLLGAWKARATAKSLAENRADPAAVHRLLTALAHPDAQTRTLAEAALRDLRAPAALDAVCAQAMRGNDLAMQLCVQQGYRPSDSGDSAVFLAATGQWDSYFEEHDGLGDLRAGYARAEDAVKARVMASARSGDARLFEFITKPRLSLRECSDAEIADAIQSGIQRQDWGRLFADCRLLPLKHALPGWQALAESGWQPDEPHDAALAQLIAGELAGQAAPLAPPEPPKGTSAVFEKWLAQGRTGELARLDEATLVQRLGTVNPPEAVPIVSALSALGTVSDATRKAVRESEHWLIRLAGYITGLASDAGSLESSAANDSNFWIRELAGADAVWTFWPEDGTPEHLKKLDAVPREALLGEAGRSRRILRALLAHGQTGFVLEKDTVAADEGSIELTRDTPQLERTPRKK